MIEDRIDSRGALASLADGLSSAGLSLRARWVGMRSRTFDLSAGVIKWLEHRLSAKIWLFKWYGRLFYQRVVERELGLTRLEPGARVLHIGAGALPYTAYYLARRGYRIDAVDHDGQMLGRARQLLEATGLSSRVQLLEQDGLEVEASPYCAIWISLHLRCKEAVLERLARIAVPGTWIVFREPRSWLKLFYSSVERPFDLPGWRSAACAHRLGKQSIAIRVSAGMDGT